MHFPEQRLKSKVAFGLCDLISRAKFLEKERHVYHFMQNNRCFYIPPQYLAFSHLALLFESCCSTLCSNCLLTVCTYQSILTEICNDFVFGKVFYNFIQPSKAVSIVSAPKNYWILAKLMRCDKDIALYYILGGKKLQKEKKFLKFTGYWAFEWKDHFKVKWYKFFSCLPLTFICSVSVNPRWLANSSDLIQETKLFGNWKRP